VFAAALLASGGGAADAKTGQSPACERFCMSVKPAEAAEGSVFTFTGRHWRPNRRVTATFGVYCRPDEACIEIAYIVRLRTGDRGGFRFHLRGGYARPGDKAQGIHAGSDPTFAQRVGRAGRSRFVSRSPRYRVLQSGSVTEPSSAIAQRGLWAISQGWPSGSMKAAE
jgi:hypothetical protein